MGDFQAVRSGGEISTSIAELLERAAPADFNGSNRAKTIRECNDVLQNRSDLSIDMLCELLEQICGPGYTEQLASLKQDMQAFFHQSLLRTWRYTKTGDQEYPYQMFDLDPDHPLKIIDQQLFDHAAEHGFPPDFFKRSYFDKVTVYCMPDNVDCSWSQFDNCRFSVCGIRGAVFDNSKIHGTDFLSDLLTMVNFTGASIAHSRFHDSELVSVSFQDAALKSCSMLDCKLDRVDFDGATLDGAQFGRINAAHIFNLRRAVITQGGATQEDVQRLCVSTFRELGVPMFPTKQHPTTGRGRKTLRPER